MLFIEISNMLSGDSEGDYDGLEHRARLSVVVFCKDVKRVPIWVIVDGGGWCPPRSQLDGLRLPPGLEHEH